MRIVVTGSIAFDYLMTFPGYFRDHLLPEHLEKVSLSFLVDSMTRQRGGTAANIAYTLALLRGKPYLFATAGEDFTEYREWLEQAGVDTRGVRVIDGEYTASFFANTDKSNAQIASFYPGAMGFANTISLKELDFRPDLVVISPDDPKAMKMHEQECFELGIPVLFDPSQQLVRMSSEDIQVGVEQASMLFVNAYEFELLQKHTGMRLGDLRTKLDFLVVTLGENGSRIYVKDEQYDIPVVPVQQILDPTGVGDAFRGGFLTGYRLGLDWEICGKMGALAAAYCLEQRGTQNHRYTPEEFIRRFRDHFEDGGVLDVLIH